jgi:hypothetical protein
LVVLYHYWMFFPFKNHSNIKNTRKEKKSILFYHLN